MGMAVAIPTFASTVWSVAKRNRGPYGGDRSITRDIAGLLFPVKVWLQDLLLSINIRAQPLLQRVHTAESPVRNHFSVGLFSRYVPTSEGTINVPPQAGSES